ncbi:DUF1731 domain-containing protein [Herbidospora galbida]|uniref:DUF1731 domain-containing protein n=1 Tax=Herbidospora galbida TaxID=2575442 RepID=UPI001FE3C2CC|nr:DUF1731 domain-containing protein [Herbidospora galbida]
MIRLFKTAKESAIKSRAQAIYQLKAVLVRADPALREHLTGFSNPKLIRACAQFPLGPVTTSKAAAAYTLRSLAQRIIHLTVEIDDLNTQITAAINSHQPHLRAALGVPVGLPATRWMAELGAFTLRTDTELLLKSRRVVPGRLVAAGFAFDHPDWVGAVEDLVRRARG